MENRYAAVKIDTPPSKSATLRDVAERAGVSVATASRVVSGSAAVRPATRARVERAIRDLLYVPPGRVGAEWRDRPPRAGVRQPRVRDARPGDGDPRHGRRLRDDPLQHRRLRDARGRLRPHAARAPRRGNGLHLLGDHRRPRRAPALRAAPRSGRAPRVRQRQLRVAAGHVGRGRRAGVGPDRDGAPARARSPPDRLRRGRRVRPARRARRRAAARTRSPPQASSRPRTPPTRSFDVDGGRHALARDPRRGERRPARRR